MVQFNSSICHRLNFFSIPVFFYLCVQLDCIENSYSKKKIRSVFSRLSALPFSCSLRYIKNNFRNFYLLKRSPPPPPSPPLRPSLQLCIHLPLARALSLALPSLPHMQNPHVPCWPKRTAMPERPLNSRSPLCGRSASRSSGGPLFRIAGQGSSIGAACQRRRDGGKAGAERDGGKAGAERTAVPLPHRSRQGPLEP
jgi:hypothetical protein